MIAIKILEVVHRLNGRLLITTCLANLGKIKVHVLGPFKAKQNGFLVHISYFIILKRY